MSASPSSEKADQASRHCAWSAEAQAEKGSRGQQAIGHKLFQPGGREAFRRRIILIVGGGYLAHPGSLAQRAAFAMR